MKYGATARMNENEHKNMLLNPQRRIEQYTVFVICVHVGDGTYRSIFVSANMYVNM